MEDEWYEYDHDKHARARLEAAKSLGCSFYDKYLYTMQTGTSIPMIDDVTPEEISEYEESRRIKREQFEANKSFLTKCKDWYRRQYPEHRGVGVAVVTHDQDGSCHRWH